MAKYSTPVYLVAAIVAIVILSSTIDIIDAAFETHLAEYTGIWFALAVTVLFIAYLVHAYKAWRK